MRKGKFLIIGLCALSAAALLGWSIRKAPFSASSRLPREFEATVVVIEKAGEREWVVPRAAVVEPEGGDGAYVFRLEKLRAKRIGVFPAGLNGEKLIVKSGLLAPGDPVLIDPASIQDGAAIAVTGGLDERSLVQLTLDAAIAITKSFEFRGYTAISRGTSSTL